MAYHCHHGGTHVKHKDKTVLLTDVKDVCAWSQLVPSKD